VTKTVISLNLATHHFTVTLQAISGLSPTTSVISTLPYYEYTLAGYLLVIVSSRYRSKLFSQANIAMPSLDPGTEAVQRHLQACFQALASLFSAVFKDWQLKRHCPDAWHSHWEFDIPKVGAAFQIPCQSFGKLTFSITIIVCNVLAKHNLSLTPKWQDDTLACSVSREYA